MTDSVVNESSPYDLTYLNVKGWGSDGFGKVSPDDAAVIDMELSPHFKPGSTILELGFGNGGVASWCRANGVRWYGVELNSHLVEMANSSGFCAFSSIEDLPMGIMIDGAVAFDVLEHIHTDFVTCWMRSIFERLNEGAVFLLRFPNGDSPFGRIAQNGDPTHINAIGRGKLMHYGLSSGFTLVGIKAAAIPLTGISFKRFLGRIFVLLARRTLSQLCRFIFFGGVYIPLDSNYVVVLRKSANIKVALARKPDGS